MLLDLLLDIVHKWRLSDLFLLISLAFTFSGSWLVAVFVGFRILKVKVKLKHTIPGVLLLTCVSLFIKPFTPGVLVFFVVLIPLFLLLKYYSKSRWIIVFFVSAILFVSSAIFPMLLISPLSSSNHAVELFFFKNKFALPVINFIETLGIIILLVIINIFNIVIIPSSGKTVFIDAFVFGGLLFWCFRSTMKVWESPGKFLTVTFIEWIVAAAVLAAFSIGKVNRDQEYQELNKKYQNLKGITDIPDFGDKLDTYFPQREQEILRSLAQGMDNAAIAENLHIAIGTVANVISKLRIKLELESRDRLVLFAIAWASKNKK